jgi:hypothetical protein
MSTGATSNHLIYRTIPSMLAILFDTPHSHKVSLCNHAKLNSGVLGSPLDYQH